MTDGLHKFQKERKKTEFGELNNQIMSFIFYNCCFYGIHKRKTILQFRDGIHTSSSSCKNYSDTIQNNLNITAIFYCFVFIQSSEAFSQ